MVDTINHHPITPLSTTAEHVCETLACNSANTVRPVLVSERTDLSSCGQALFMKTGTVHEYQVLPLLMPVVLAASPLYSHPPRQPLWMLLHPFPVPVSVTFISFVLFDPTSSHAQGPPKKQQQKNESEFCCDEKIR
jgi:hypothetical protein